MLFTGGGSSGASPLGPGNGAGGLWHGWLGACRTRTLMQKFEQLHAEQQLDLAVEALRVMCDAKCPTLGRLIAKRECTPIELWREICAERGYDECEPWRVGRQDRNETS